VVFNRGLMEHFYCTRHDARVEGPNRRRNGWQPWQIDSVRAL